jgi:proline iminopeptidase
MPDYRPLYPEIEPYQTGLLDVGDGHRIYFEQSGNPDGMPAVYVHGGPGGGSSPGQRRVFDPERYRIILFDQRGCGRSQPWASLENNTTWHLVADMERLREHLGIEHWQVCGGSWGSTLSLAYAVTHAERVTALVLRGIFTLQRRELDWYYQGGAANLFPDEWEKFVAPIPEAERDDLIGAYYRRLTGDDPETRRECARSWSMWEGATINLLQRPEQIEQFGSDGYAEAFARIESHYFHNRGFFDSDDWLLGQARTIAGIPTTIIQGRYDVCTPMVTAWDLHRALPEADFHIIPDAGHAFDEPGIADALVRTTDRYAISR